MWHHAIIGPLVVLGKGAVLAGKGAVTLHHVIAAHAAQIALVDGGTTSGCGRRA
jgi:hypothetical protein